MSRKLGSDLATYSVLLYITCYSIGIFFTFEVQNEKGREVTFTECLVCANMLLLVQRLLRVLTMGSTLREGLYSCVLLNSPNNPIR